MNCSFPSLISAIVFVVIAFSDIKVNADTIISDDFASCTKTDNPWSCVDRLGQIKAIAGTQLIVDDAGHITYSPVSPSVAVGDLNGDGLPDLVIADSWGFFWYFQNHGTRDAPKFTTAEVMPIWFGDPCPNFWEQYGLVTHGIVPRIQLIDFDGDGKLDLVVGSYLGRLFYLRNQGTSQSPLFKMPKKLDDITIPTRHGGTLWCNYLSPFLYDWQSNGHLDLILGDGTYSANSIFFLQNKGTNDQPTFSEEAMAQIIPGMGREHLIPQVVSWDGDGKADVLTIERAGFLNIFLNKGTDPNSGYPTFDDGHHVLVGGQEKLHEGCSVTMAKLTDTGLPGLVIGNADGHVYFSQNIGKPNDFQFSAPTPIEGINTRPPILVPTGWVLDGGYGAPYDLLVCTNAQVEPGFKPPPDPGVTNALRFYIDEPAQPNPTFPDHFYPASDLRQIGRRDGFILTAGKRYKLSFWVRTDGNLSNLKYRFGGDQQGPNSNGLGITLTDNVDSSSDWSHYTTSIHFQSLTDDENATVGFIFSLNFTGKGSLYLASFKLEDDE